MLRHQTLQSKQTGMAKQIRTDLAYARLNSTTRLRCKFVCVKAGVSSGDGWSLSVLTLKPTSQRAESKARSCSRVRAFVLFETINRVDRWTDE